jgi:predicted dehydrogenase
MKNSHLILPILILQLMSSCHNSATPGSGSDTAQNTGQTPDRTQRPVRLVTLDPGHFHAALVQKSMYPGVDSNVYVYAPMGQDIRSHLALISAYNTRPNDPTRWNEHVYTGVGYLEQMINDKKGNTVVLAGNNHEKTTYIRRSLEGGFNVLADKPMVIDDQAFGQLRQAFDTAAAKNLILYDIMTERYEITSILQRELAAMPAVFGTQEKGDTRHPGVIASSVHRWYKNVSGNALIRPAWFFDINQQGEGIVDVMTHLVDLIQWGCFPDQTLDYTKDIQVDHARHWTTDLPRAQFRTITGMTEFPDFLQKYADPKKDSILKIYANGEIDYRLRDVFIKATVTWTYDAPPGAGDTYTSLMRGTRANLAILQDTAQHYQSTLYIEPNTTDPAYGQTLNAQFATLQAKYPGISLQKEGARYIVIIPDHYKEGHEAHFARVTAKFLGYVRDHHMPSWEVPNMIAKYYTTTTGLGLARKKVK